MNGCDLQFMQDADTVLNRSFGLSQLSRTPRTVLGALVPGVLSPGAAKRILSVVRSREADSLHDLAM